DARDGVRRNAGAVERGLHGMADRGPNVLGIVLGMIGLRPVHGYRMFGAAKHVAGAVEDAGARTARADIDGADMPARHRLPASMSGSCRMSENVRSGRRIASSATSVR